MKQATYPIKEITNKDEFLKWSNDVNNSQNTHPPAFICDLQDVFARSNPTTIKTIFLETVRPGSQETRLLTFAIHKAMGEEPLFSILKSWARQEAEKIILDYQKEVDQANDRIFEREKVLDKKKVIFEECKKPLHKKLRTFIKENKSLKDQLIKEIECNTTLREANQVLRHKRIELEREVNDLTSKTRDYNTLKAALKGFFE